MKTENWIVLEDSKGNHLHLYHSMYEKNKTSYERMKVLSYEEWNVFDITKILGEILKSKEFRHADKLSYGILEILKSYGVSDKGQLEIMKKILESQEEDN